MTSENRDLATEIDTLKKDLEKLRDDVASLVSAAGGTAGDQMKLQRRRAHAAAESASGQTVEAFEVAAKKQAVAAAKAWTHWSSRSRSVQSPVSWWRSASGSSSAE